MVLNRDVYNFPQDGLKTLALCEFEKSLHQSQIGNANMFLMNLNVSLNCAASGNGKS